MTILRKKSPTSAALTEELVQARTQYESTRDSVLGKAESRREVVRSTIGDLEVEDDELQAVIDEATA